MSYVLQFLYLDIDFQPIENPGPAKLQEGCDILAGFLPPKVIRAKENQVTVCCGGVSHRSGSGLGTVD